MPRQIKESLRGWRDTSTTYSTQQSTKMRLREIARDDDANYELCSTTQIQRVMANKSLQVHTTENYVGLNF